MKKIMLGIFVILFFINFSSGFLIETEEDFLTKGDQYYFKVCGINDDLDLSVYCLNDTDLKIKKGVESCNIYGFDSEDLNCDQPIIVAKEGVNTVEKIIRMVDYEGAIENNLYSKHKNAVDIAAKVYAHSLLGNEEMIPELMEKLKESRNDNEKCWPITACNSYESVNVAYYLSKAGMNRTNRVYNDLLLWLESKQNEEESKNWSIEIDASENATCNIYLDDSLSEEIDFGNNDSWELLLDYESGQKLRITCDYEFCTTIEDLFGQNLKNRTCKDPEENLTYSRDGNCWPSHPYTAPEECSALTSSMVLNLNELNDDSFTRGVSWIENEISRGRIAGEKLKTTSDVLSHLYSYNVLDDDDEKKEEVKTWILFSQRNDGYFGNEDNYLGTLEFLNTMSNYTLNKEWISDARKWIFENIPSSGWDNIILDSMMYDIFNKEKSVRISPLIPESEGENIDFSLINVDENHTVILEGDIEDIATLVYENKKGKIIIDSKKEGLYSGNIVLSEKDYSKKFPVLVYNKPGINLDLNENYFFKEKEGEIVVPFDKSDSDLECNFYFNNSFQNISKKLTNEEFINFQYSVEKDGTYDIDLNVDCVSETESVSKSYDFVLRVYENGIFSASADEEIGLEDYGVLKIENNVDEEIEISLKFLTSSNYYSLPESILIGEGEIARIFLYQNLETGTNETTTEENTIYAESFGYSEELPILFNLGNTALIMEEDYEVGKNSNWFLIIFLAIILIILGAVGYFGWRKKEKLKDIFNKIISKFKKKKKEDEKKGDEKKGDENGKGRDEKKDARKNVSELVALFDEYLGESDEEIREELKGEGYSDDEIDETIKEVNEISEKNKQEKKELNEDEKKDEEKEKKE